jgi:hypothetical protein
MNGDEKEGQRLLRGFRQKERIETQIHRRRKVKAFSPLESEWESPQAEPSSCGLMNKAKEIRRLMPDREWQEEPNCSPYSPLSDRHT